jgi:hypothetical protein
LPELSCFCIARFRVVKTPERDSYTDQIFLVI